VRIALYARLRHAFQTRAALGLRPVTAPVVVFIPLGFLIGPHGLGVLTPQALSHLDVVVTVGLATLGVFIGVAAGREGSALRRLFAASTLEAVTTLVIVGGALAVLLELWNLPLAMPYAIAAMALAVCASASAATSVGPADARTRQIAAQVADLDDVLPIAVGAVVIGLASRQDLHPATTALLAVGAGLAIGVAGWLLFERAQGSAERSVFVIGTLAMLGGSAAYVGGSPLLTGMTAGWLWAVAPGGTDRVAAAELQKVQHPLVVVLLITAGAATDLSLAGVWLFAPYVVFRLAGKLLGGWAASRFAPGVAPSDLGAYLVPPGVIGIAFALNLLQVLPGAGAPIVFAVAVGAIACELLALVVTPLPRATR
jgi:hypothetical protein